MISEEYKKDKDNIELAQWAALGVSLGTNLIASLVIVLRGDIVWCVGATWLCVSMWSERGRPAAVEVGTVSLSSSFKYN